MVANGRTPATIRAWQRGGRSSVAVDGEANVQSRTEPVPIQRQSQRTMIRVSSLTIVMTTNAHVDSKRESVAIGS
ncbi:hypothetical protein GPL21_15630 [Bradyrhizobium pachyrhizi]|uniref:Uncharacterized protein n=1 Tax=Bradyrhizobium pachyrhizi TaxID=280333 RepID=A0A844SHP5_9BRAD|nr:hypothetical protein [Bradyrhizobium pachyrhizi]MVT66528.1 hypothetical protein [Bradyrhizobium pachyrhizi]WFU57194.1 hypothetical protein QA639_06630 [Bradyrhizobium pachyrhizi]